MPILSKSAKQLLKHVKKASQANGFLFAKPKLDLGTKAANDFMLVNVLKAKDQSNRTGRKAVIGLPGKRRTKRAKQRVPEVCTCIQEVQES